MLKQRVVTAVILALFFLGILFGLPMAGFAVVLAIIVMVAAWEWADLAGLQAPWKRYAYAIFIGCCIAVVAAYSHLFEASWAGGDVIAIRDILLVAALWWAISLLWVQGYPSSALLWDRFWVKAAVGVLVLVPAWLSLVFLHGRENGQWLILLVILLVACADIGAYFSGKAFGKHKLAPAVSPGKSWEGFWGGFAACLLLGVVIAYCLGGNWLILALIVPASLISVLGDLSESMFKRQRGIKDSSQLLPGHGGLLDRVDGVTAAAPIFSLALILSQWQF